MRTTKQDNRDCNFSLDFSARDKQLLLELLRNPPCKECGDELVEVGDGKYLVCPNGHGKLVPNSEGIEWLK